jgi:peptide/nickel transport system substrate-binding protein
MSKFKKRLIIGQFLIIFCLCLFSVISCQRNYHSLVTEKSLSNSINQSSGRIIIGTTLKPRTLDPSDAYDMIGLNTIYNIGDSLYTYKLGTTQLQPRLATQLPKISSDGLTYKIPLRSDVIFQDGTHFNAAAMTFSLRRFIANKGQPSFLLSDLIESVQATSEYELTIKLKKQFVAFPALLSFSGTSAVSPKAYEIGSGKFKPNEFVGTGAYKLRQFTSELLHLDLFEKYWGKKPLNKGVDIQIFSNGANLFNAFRTHAIDVAYFSLEPDQIESLKQEALIGKWQVITSPGTTVNYLGLNLRQKPLDNLVVRQAIAMLIDRKLLNQRVLKNQSEPLYSLLPKVFNVYKPVFKTQYGDGNIEKAKQLLQQAGYSSNNPLKLQIWYPSTSTTRGLVAQTLKAFVEQNLGGVMQLEVNTIESTSYLKNIGKGLYQMFLLEWYPDFLDPDNYIQPFVECSEGSLEKGCKEGGSQTLGSFYYKERVNQLISQERKTQNAKVRAAIFGEIQKIIAEDIPYIPLWQSKNYIFAYPSLIDVNIEPNYSLPFWKIQKSH